MTSMAAATGMAKSTPWTTPQALEAVRPRIRAALMAIPAYQCLSADEQRDLASNMVKVMAYISDPNGVMTEAAGGPGTRATARALGDDPVQATKSMLSAPPQTAGQDFKAGAVREGVEQFGALVKKVDFPKFVGGLIKNVFQAIVESSIEQMRAYGELISNVAKTVGDFANDNISPAAGRDWLAQKYPDTLEVQPGAQAGGLAEGAEAPVPPPVLAAKGENPEIKLAEVSRDLGIIPPITAIDDPQAELKVVTAARLQMAKSRQQMLASMVMLGINRIVITDGSITAKVIFDMRAEDKVKRTYSAQMNDTESQRAATSMNAGYGGWMSPVSADMHAEAETNHVATVGSAVDETSESKAEVKAKLSGEVRVNFKSDYLPLEKMATPEMMSTIQGNSTPYNPNAKAQPAA
ncbi:MAG TPA: hypothetical protein VNU21_19840 [Usitatibacter sp.]|nr:hypothetical protein [Usitatibacter sp.]